MEKFLAEGKLIKADYPVDLNTAGLSGVRVDVTKCRRLAFVVVLGGSTGSTVSFTLKQHTAASGGTTADLSVDNRYFKKVGAATVFTEVEPTVEAAAYDLSADFAAAQGIVVFEILPENMDVNNGFKYASIEVADSGTAKLASILYVGNPKSEAAYGDAF